MKLYISLSGLVLFTFDFSVRATGIVLAIFEEALSCALQYP
jgi:hypothetical protein